MSKFNYYGAYGRNRGGIYRSYEKLQKAGQYIDGLKLKGFLFKDEAVNFVVDGLSNVYKVMEADEIDTDLLKRTGNRNYSIAELRKKIDVITICAPDEKE